MKKISYVFVVLWALGSAPSNAAQVSIGVGLPHINIGINFPVFPDLVVVPGYPVYYAPHVQANLFFYDGEYWLYQDDNWYASTWYNGPWVVVDPEFVPLFVLRIPVRFYVRPPVYFRGWVLGAPPRWGEHWGRDWEHRRSGWNKWDRNIRHDPAPLPVYQRKYSGKRYPWQIERQHELQNRLYRYQSRDPIIQQRRQVRSLNSAQKQQGSESVPRVRSQQKNGSKERERKTIQNRDQQYWSGTTRYERQGQKTQNRGKQSQGWNGESEYKRGKKQDKESGKGRH